jgi:hypothetical protein
MGEAVTAMPNLTLAYRGYNYVDFYNGEYASGNLNSLNSVAATGAHSVALTPDFGIDVAQSSIYAGGITTDTVADQQAAIAAATQQGMTSFVRPLIDFLYDQSSPHGTEFGDSYYGTFNYDSRNLPTGEPDANGGTIPNTTPANPGGAGFTNYRGALNPADMNVATFFGSPTTPGSYDYMIVNEAKMAAAAGATLFAVGTELDSLADNPAYTSDWTTLIADIRAAAPSLKLTFSANWATASQVTFWNALDYVGIDGYVPLSNVIPDANNDNNPSLQSLINGWTQPSNVQIAFSGGETVSQALGGKSAVDYFDTLAQQSISHQFIFSEVGYQNDTGAATDPTGGSNQGVVDPSLQAELYAAFYYAWGGAQQQASATGNVDGIPFALNGAYFWDWTPDGQNDDWTVAANPAAISVIEQGFGPNSYDFTNAGYGDVLVENGSGQIVYGKMSAGAFQNWVNLAGASGYTVDGQGKISGGADSDFVVENAGGSIYYGDIVGGAFSAWVPVATAPGFNVVGVGDMNGDRYADIVVQNANINNGQIVYGNMNGGVFHNWVNVTSTPGFTVGAVADINNDGYADIVVGNPNTGQLLYANMANGAFNNWVNVASAPGWTLVGAGDVNRDGYADIVVQNQAANSGQIVYANMANGVFNGWVGVATCPGFNVVAVEDVIGNGFDDIVVENANTGQIVYANMTGGTFQGWVNVAGAPGFTVHTGPANAGARTIPVNAAALGMPAADPSTILSAATLQQAPNFGTL